MGLPQPVKRFTPEEYYRLERESEYKSDYYDGEIFAMGGGTIRHSRIATNMIVSLSNRLVGKPCSVHESNLRLKILATGLRTYPDVGVYCGPLLRDPDDPDGDTVTNPTVLFEVLSKTTEAYDRGFKSQNYRAIESLRAYVLVSQHAPHLEIYERQAGGAWLLNEVRRLDGVLALGPLGIDLPLAEVYDRVDFTAE